MPEFASPDTLSWTQVAVRMGFATLLPFLIGLVLLVASGPFTAKWDAEHQPDGSEDASDTDTSAA